ncbi:MAG: J domain-containing protein [Chloroflexota bacterium]|nr:J domain-containing protein [Chloroflexota bacterium]
MVIPQATRKRGGGIVLRFPYNPGLIERLKVSIPSVCRSWDPVLKVWTVEAAYANLAIGLLQSTYPEATVGGSTAPPRGPDPIRPSDPHYEALHLLPSAPACVVEAAYKALARDRHPDRLPAHERDRAHEAMVALNEAYDALRARGAA